MSILRRLKSLEDFLGLVYKRKELKGDYEEHVVEEYSKIGGIEKSLRNIEKFLESKFPEKFDSKNRYDF